MHQPPPLLALDAAGTRRGAQHFGPFSFTLQPNERVAILGPSGVGKSTLLALLAGDIAPTSGTVAFAGQALARWPSAQLSRRRALLPQQSTLAFAFPSELVVSLGRVARAHDPALGTIVSLAMQLAQAEHLRGRRFDRLSGGEQARVQLARLFAQLWDEHQGLILLDEPLAALDPGLQFALLDRLELFAGARRHAVVAVLHDLNHAFSAFDRLLLLDQQRLLADLAADRQALAPLEQLFGIRLRPVSGAHERLQLALARASR